MKKRIYKMSLVLLTLLALLVPGCVGKNTCPCPTSAKPAATLPAPVLAVHPAEATAYVVVRPPEELLDLAYAIAGDSEYKEFYRQAFLYFMRRGSSGSGFAIKSFYKIDKDRKLYPHTYVFTNRHVVFGASETSVSFDGGKTSSRGEIVYVSTKYDLAVLDIPISHSILKLDTSVIEEETPVGALGYPAVGMKGSYHVFNGIISRSCFSLSEVDPDKSEECMLGTSAALDHGNSGGPVVLLDEKTKRTTNRVIGVNTIMFSDLHDKFYAIPAPAVAEVLKEAEEVDKHRYDREWLTTELKTSCRNFLAEITSASAQIDRLMPQISYRFVVEKGFDAFLEWDHPYKNKMLARFPGQAMQAALVFSIRNDLQSHKGVSQFEKCEHINPTDDILVSNRDVRTTFDFRDGNTGELSWRRKMGIWQATNYHFLPKEKKDSEKSEE